MSHSSLAGRGWEGDLIVGEGGKSAAATVVERTSRYTLILLIRDYIPKGEDISSDQHYLDGVSAELNERPRAVLGFFPPREAFERLLLADLASTG